MTRVLRHVVLPALAPAAIVALYFTPVSLIGCANRGLAALAIVFVSLAAGVALTLLGAQAKRRGDPDYIWPLLAALILLTPAALVLGPLG